MVCDRCNGKPQYICRSYRQRPGSCERYSVHERETLKLILRELRRQFFDRYFSETNVERLKIRRREIWKVATGRRRKWLRHS